MVVVARDRNLGVCSDGVSPTSGPKTPELVERLL